MSFPKYETAIAQRHAAIKKNRAFFLTQMDNLVDDHYGQYALLRDEKIIGYYDSAGDAVQAAMCHFPDDASYSVEKIDPEPIYMGMRADVVVTSRN